MTAAPWPRRWSKPRYCWRTSMGSPQRPSSTPVTAVWITASQRCRWRSSRQEHGADRHAAPLAQAASGDRAGHLPHEARQRHAQVLAQGQRGRRLARRAVRGRLHIRWLLCAFVRAGLAALLLGLRSLTALPGRPCTTPRPPQTNRQPSSIGSQSSRAELTKHAQ